MVKQAFETGKGRSGPPRLVLGLADAVHVCDRKTVARGRTRQLLRAKTAKKVKSMTHSNHQLPVTANLLQQDFCASEPNQKWVGDITFLRTDEGWLYVATVIDLCSSMVVGWSMSKRMAAGLVCAQ
jgi:putative transposase